MPLSAQLEISRFAYPKVGLQCRRRVLLRGWASYGTGGAFAPCKLQPEELRDMSDHQACAIRLKDAGRRSKLSSAGGWRRHGEGRQATSPPSCSDRPFRTSERLQPSSALSITGPSATVQLLLDRISTCNRSSASPIRSSSAARNGTSISNVGCRPSSVGIREDEVVGAGATRALLFPKRCHSQYNCFPVPGSYLTDAIRRS